MRFLVIHWHTARPYAEEIARQLQEDGHTVFLCQTAPRNFHYDPVFRRNFTDAVEGKKVQAVFSVQYFPLLSNLCEKISLPYICWCFRHPLNRLLLTKSLENTCNFFFLADKELASQMARAGAPHVFHLPWAAIPSPDFPPPDSSVRDVSLLDSSDPDAWTKYLTLCSRLDERTKGFLHGLLNAQQNISQSHFLSNALNPSILQALCKALPLQGPRDNIASLEDLYAREILYPAVARKDIDKLLRILESENRWKITYFTKSPRDNLRHTEQQNYPTDTLQALDVYTHSRINVLSVPRETGSAIPVQALDIMGCGGFLVANFPEPPEGFREGAEYVPFRSPEELPELIEHYLANPEKRLKIASNARKNIAENHNFKLRIREILSDLRL